MKLKDEKAVDDLFAEIGEYSIAVATCWHEPTLIYYDVQEMLCFQGVPTADEDGKHYDANCGRLDKLPKSAWPLTYLGPHKVPKKAKTA